MTLWIHIFVELSNLFPEELEKQKFNACNRRPFHEEKKLYKVINITILGSREMSTMLLDKTYILLKLPTIKTKTKNGS